MIALAVFVMVEFDFEAVTAAAEVGNRAEGGVALGADGDILVGFSVNDDRAGAVFLIGAGLYKTVPVVHDNIQSMHL